MKNLSVLSVALLCASMATAAENSIYTGTFFDDSGAYFGPDCEKDGTQSTGAYYTGDYTSPFKTFLGKTDKDIQGKLDELWNHYFYIVDINNNDIRSEGMSYGMMIAVQTNHREQFDKLWNWAKKHMWKDPATGGSGYFAWQANRDGSVRDWGNAPDGEIYFMMSLLFAAHRWNDEGYMRDAQSILKACWKGNGQSLYSEQSFIATFQPSDGNNTWGDASYSLPAFVDLFSRWSTTNTDKWKKATKATRDHIYNSANPKSGLCSDYSNFDGTPHHAFSDNSTKYAWTATGTATSTGTAPADTAISPSARPVRMQLLPTLCLKKRATRIWSRRCCRRPGIPSPSWAASATTTAWCITSPCST